MERLPQDLWNIVREFTPNRTFLVLEQNILDMLSNENMPGLSVSESQDSFEYQIRFPPQHGQPLIDLQFELDRHIIINT